MWGVYVCFRIRDLYFRGNNLRKKVFGKNEETKIYGEENIGNRFGNGIRLVMEKADISCSKMNEVWGWRLLFLWWLQHTRLNDIFLALRSYRKKAITHGTGLK